MQHPSCGGRGDNVLAWMWCVAASSNLLLDALDLHAALTFDSSRAWVCHNTRSLRALNDASIQQRDSCARGPASMVCIAGQSFSTMK